MKLAGKYIEFDELLTPQTRLNLGPGYENITPAQRKALENALRAIGTAPPGSEQAIQGMIQLGQIQNAIGAGQGSKR
jgi:hypothetical protein